MSPLSRFLPPIPELTDIVSVIDQYDYIVFLGTGGSSLTGQALKGIASCDKITFF